VHKNLIGLWASFDLKQLFEKDLYSRLRNFVLGIKVEPREVAEIVIDRVVDYCRNNRGDTLECLADHSPDQLDVFIDAYLNGKEAEDLDKAIENSDMFWDEVKKEYEKLWKDWWSEELAYDFGHLVIEDQAKNIMNNYELDNATKVRRLKAYAEVLHELADTIKQALQNQEPLSSADLYKWFKKLAEVTSSFDSDYRKEVQYYLDFYDIWDVDQLQTLSLLLEYINRTLRSIENTYLPELEALTNES